MRYYPNIEMWENKLFNFIALFYCRKEIREYFMKNQIQRVSVIVYVHVLCKFASNVID